MPGAAGGYTIPRLEFSDEIRFGAPGRQRSGSATPRRKPDVESNGSSQRLCAEAESASSRTPRRLAGEAATITSSRLLPTLIRRHSEAELVPAAGKAVSDGENNPLHCIKTSYR